MDLPISVGLLAGFVHGTVNTVRGTGEVYFDSVTALIFLLLSGRYLQRRQQRAAGDAAELAASLYPSSARLLEDGVCARCRSRPSSPARSSRCARASWSRPTG